MKKSTDNQSRYMSLGISMGVALGASLGNMLFDNLAVGISTGLCVGMAMGLAIGKSKDDGINRRARESGLEIKEITADGDGTYSLTLANSAGETKNATVSADTAEAEKYAVGDIVFEDGEGNIVPELDKK